MPRKPLFTKEEIVEKAFNFVRHNGMQALTARDLGTFMGCSSRPIFSVFNSMDELKEEVRLKAEDFLKDYVKNSINYSPAFKEYGKRLIALAQKERNLFFLLFLSENAEETTKDPTILKIMEEMEQEFELSHEAGLVLFEQNWTYLCGMIMLIMTGAKEYDEEKLDQCMARQFQSTLMLLKSSDPTPAAIRLRHKVTSKNSTL